MTTEEMIKFVMDRRIRIIATGTDGHEFDCYPVDAKQADAWEARFKADPKWVKVVRESPEERA